MGPLRRKPDPVGRTGFRWRCAAAPRLRTRAAERGACVEDRDAILLAFRPGSRRQALPATDRRHDRPGEWQPRGIACHDEGLRADCLGLERLLERAGPGVGRGAGGSKDETVTW